MVALRRGEKNGVRRKNPLPEFQNGKRRHEFAPRIKIRNPVQFDQLEHSTRWHQFLHGLQSKSVV